MKVRLHPRKNTGSCLAFLAFLSFFELAGSMYHSRLESSVLKSSSFPCSSRNAEAFAKLRDTGLKSTKACDRSENGRYTELADV